MSEQLVLERTFGTRFGYCATCAADTPFEHPFCADGHGDLCAEWFCVDCCTAVVIDIGGYTEPTATPTGALTDSGWTPGASRRSTHVTAA